MGASMGMGALGGVFGYMGNKDAAEKQRQAMEDAIGQYDRSSEQTLNGYQSQMQGLIDGYDRQSQNYLNTPDKVNQWLNPMMDYELGQIGKMTNQQYAAGGKLNSGAKALALQDRSQNHARQGWQQAFNNMTSSNQLGMSNLQYGTGMKTGLAGNVFNAQNMADMNRFNANMGMATVQSPNLMQGVSGVLGGMGQGAQMGGSIINAFSKSPATQAAQG
jgi:hypothetical protein